MAITTWYSLYTSPFTALRKIIYSYKHTTVWKFEITNSQLENIFLRSLNVSYFHLRLHPLRVFTNSQSDQLIIN